MFLGEVFINQNAEKFVLYCVLLLFLGGPLLNINTILFSPFFTFLRAIFSRPFSLSLAPTICPWVSEDV